MKFSHTKAPGTTDESIPKWFSSYERRWCCFHKLLLANYYCHCNDAIASNYPHVNRHIFVGVNCINAMIQNSGLLTFWKLKLSCDHYISCQVWYERQVTFRLFVDFMYHLFCVIVYNSFVVPLLKAPPKSGVTIYTRNRLNFGLWFLVGVFNLILQFTRQRVFCHSPSVTR